VTSEKNNSDSRHDLSATRVIAATAGVLCGISGLEHGFFEILQGSTAPDAVLISAIGPANRFWPGGTETALTIIPNFLITGILAMLASLMVIIWSAAFIQRKHGALIFLLLSLAQFLVGGGFAQIFLVVVTAAAATQINDPLNWFRAIFPVSVRRWLAKLWLWLLVIFVLVFSSAIFAAIFGYIPIVSSLFSVRGSDLTGFLYALGYVMLVLLPLTFLAGFAYDSESA
jgi:hypothetical protein